MEAQLYCGKQILVKPLEIKPVKNRTFIKPDHGLWTSTYTPFDDYCSAWVEWCASDMPKRLTNNCFILYPMPHARIFTIDSYDDMMQLFDQFEIGHHFLNWEEISKYYDGVRITNRGQGATRLTQPYSLYGWDCESTLWFRDIFDRVIPLSEDRNRTCATGIIEERVKKPAEVISVPPEAKIEELATQYSYAEVQKMAQEHGIPSGPKVKMLTELIAKGHMMEFCYICGKEAKVKRTGIWYCESHDPVKLGY